MSEPNEQKETTDAPELIPIRVLEESGRSVLVEVPGPRRYYVPKSKIKDGNIEGPTLDKAQEYGVRWEAFLEPPDLSPETIAAALRHAGIWTLDDLKQRDRQLIRIATNLIGKAVYDAAERAATGKLPRRKK